MVINLIVASEVPQMLNLRRCLSCCLRLPPPPRRHPRNDDVNDCQQGHIEKKKKPNLCRRLAKVSQTLDVDHLFKSETKVGQLQ